MTLQEQYILCTDEDLIRGIRHFRSWKHLTDVAAREIDKMEAELHRRAVNKGKHDKE